MVRVDDMGGLTAQICWVGLRVGSRAALYYIQQMKWVNSSNDFVMTTPP